MYRITALLIATLALACGGDADSDGAAAAEGSVTALASGLENPSAEELEAGRLDASWRQYADGDVRERAAARSSGDQNASQSQGQSAAVSERVVEGGGGAAEADSATWEDISASTVNAPARGLPIHGDVAGPAVARVQILLDRVGFRPGIIDGRWGKNTEKAVYWFQHENGLESTGEVDQATLDRLEEAAGLGDRLVVSHTLTQSDVEGPFVSLPEDVYARADEECLCYESLREQLGEIFHTSPELLEQLNPDVALSAVSAGDRLQVPNVDRFLIDALPEGKVTDGGPVARIVISDGGHYLHAMRADGSILYHFPTTLGSDYAPSPTGEFSVESITFGPTWHYKPDLLTGVDPSRPDAVLPEGPNNAVGVVWMQLSMDHYGIHGTSAPATIGYVTSHGCVRLTNWDAALLGQNIPPGVPVVFRDVT